MAILRQIQAKISNGAGPFSLLDLSSQFYTIIPHSCGTSAPPAIRNLEEVDAKVELLLSLLDAVPKIKKEASALPVVNPLDHVYSALNCSIRHLEPGPELDMLHKLIVRVLPMFSHGMIVTTMSSQNRQASTHGETHQDYGMSIDVAYTVCRDEETIRFEPHKHCTNRKLLFHGTRSCNLMGILSQVF